VASVARQLTGFQPLLLALFLLTQAEDLAVKAVVPLARQMRETNAFDTPMRCVG
jgi:hypothetical protein